MKDDLGASTDKEQTKLLSPMTWFIYSSALLALIVVPTSVAVFYMFRISEKFDLLLQNSVLMGLGAGIILSLVLGFAYSRWAMVKAQ